MARKPILKILHNGKQYLSLSFASSLSGYHRERLRQLINEGKLQGERIGSSWFIAEDVFAKFSQKISNIQIGNESNKRGEINGSEELHRKIDELNSKLNLLNTKFVNTKTDPSRLDEAGPVSLASLHGRSGPRAIRGGPLGSGTLG